MENRNLMDMMEANAVSHRSKLGHAAPQLEHTEIVHHMTHGEPIRHLIEPGKMAEHMGGNDCPHCGTMGDPESAAGAAT